jgi:hypothetical protein
MTQAHWYCGMRAGIAIKGIIQIVGSPFKFVNVSHGIDLGHIYHL